MDFSSKAKSCNIRYFAAAKCTVLNLVQCVLTHVECVLYTREMENCGRYAEQSTKFSTEHLHSLAFVSLSWIVEIRNSGFIIAPDPMTKPEF